MVIGRDEAKQPASEWISYKWKFAELIAEAEQKKATLMMEQDTAVDANSGGYELDAGKERVDHG
ncbi:MAG: hypothetical protein LUD12_15775 [Lachnospiraceae bacterium]|nr:hypothetical protein [Lachnospiraceae bacterium]